MLYQSADYNLRNANGLGNMVKKSGNTLYVGKAYEYNRDKGRCKICENNIAPYFRHCHRIKPALAIDKINKVPNLAWLCYDCLKVVKSGTVPENATSKMKSKILKYQGRLKVLN